LWHRIEDKNSADIKQCAGTETKRVQIESESRDTGTGNKSWQIGKYETEKELELKIS